MGTKIEWTGKTWPVTTGCSRISPGCGTHLGGCYAERTAWRLSHNPATPQYEGTVRKTDHGPRWTGVVKPFEGDLLAPLSWRKPTLVFVDSMSDLFHADVPFEHIDKVFAVMLACEFLAGRAKHVFQVLTKRAERLAEYFSSPPVDLLKRWAKAGDSLITMDDPDMYFSEYVEGHCSARWDENGCATEKPSSWSRPENLFPLPNVWIGVSVEDQKRADERIPHLLRVPSAVLFLSCEPLLERLDLSPWLRSTWTCEACGRSCSPVDRCACGVFGALVRRRLSWVIVGGESGPKSRPCNIAWIRSVVEQCADAGLPCFAKQLGAHVIDRNDAGFDGVEDDEWPDTITPDMVEHDLDGTRDGYQGAPVRIHLRHKKGGDPAEWPRDLRVRQMPGGMTPPKDDTRCLPVVQDTADEIDITDDDTGGR